MAKIAKKDLDSLSSDQIKAFFLNEDVSKMPSPIKEYVEEGVEYHNTGLRIIRVEKILSGIIVERFIKGTL